MAIFNFTISAIPVIFLFSCYAGILCSNDKQIKIAELPIKQHIAKIIFLTLTCVTFYITYGQIKQAKDQRQNKRAHVFLESGNLEAAENLLTPLKESQQNTVSFCMIYGNLLYLQNKYNDALFQFNYAKKFSSKPILYYMASQCLFQLRDTNGAISNLYQVVSLSPKTMKYKFELMQLLASDKQVDKACTIAKQIINMQVINPNESTSKYQNKAKLLLQKVQKK